MVSGSLSTNKKCVKCPEEACFAGIDVKKAVYCKNCFIQMVKHKFRSGLSKRRIFKDGEAPEVLVVFDGTSSSAFLFHQIKEALNQTSFKKLMINPTIVLLISSMDIDEIHEATGHVDKLKQHLPTIEVLPVHVAWFLEKDVDIAPSSSTCHGIQMVDTLSDILKSCKTDTMRNEVFRLSKEKTLEKVANCLSITKIMMPEEGDTLGRLALSQLCMGRGPSISSLTSIFERRPSGLAFIRPLRDVCQKEISIVNHLEGYDDITLRLKHSFKSAPNSIQAMSSNFVDVLLKEGFKSTVTTVLSTAGKLHLLNSQSLCLLCQLGPISHDNLCDTCHSLSSELQNKEYMSMLIQ